MNQVDGKPTSKTIIYPELSYQVMGLLFKIHTKLGPAYQEKYYQRAIETELAQSQIPYEREKFIQLKYQETPIGKYFLDFIIDNKLILETKSIDYFTRKDYRQVMAYLNATKLKLAILVNFNSSRLIHNRIVNPRI